MRHVSIAALGLALAGCVTTGNSHSAGIKPLGGDTYMVSEMTGFTNVVERAAVFCGRFGQTIDVQGNTTQQGLASGRDYAVLVFRCVS